MQQTMQLFFDYTAGIDAEEHDNNANDNNATEKQQWIPEEHISPPPIDEIEISEIIEETEEETEDEVEEGKHIIYCFWAY